MRHYAHHIGDYRAHTAHLSFLEDAAYRRMLDVYYMHEKPLPLDPAEAQRLVGARSRDEKNAVRIILQEFFTKEEDGWHQKRADEVIAEYRGKAETARNNGRKSGGRPKPNKEPSDNQSGSSSVPTEATNHKPETINQKPEEVEGADAPRPPAEPVRTLVLEPDLDIPPTLDRTPEGMALRMWNTTAERIGLPIAQKLTDPRRKALKARLSESGGLEGWRTALEKVEDSSFLTGKSGRTGEHANWRCDLDFILRQAKFTKLMEGGFDDTPGHTNGSSSRPVQHGGESPTAVGVAAAFARRSVLAGG